MNKPFLYEFPNFGKHAEIQPKIAKVVLLSSRIYLRDCSDRKARIGALLWGYHCRCCCNGGCLVEDGVNGDSGELWG